ncbi:MAG: hypothetical protein H0W90_05000 [Actinobacteria bacterium]|nr:hypothetical protein [Actinomycetota bacterium]
MTPVRAFSLSLAALLVVLAGCGSSPKTVTKAQYQTEIERVGADLSDAGSQVGKLRDIASFNQSVENFQEHLRDASKKLKGLKPPANTQDVNKQLAGSFHDVADELEPVKDARRESIVEAGKALTKVAKSQTVKDGRAAIQRLKELGYDTSELHPF